MMVEFLPISEDNYKEVARIDSECLGEEGWSENLYRDELSDKEKHYFVAYVDQIPVGFGGFAQIFDEGHIMNIAVLREYRRQGIATNLLDKMIEAGKELGISSFTLEVRDDNEGAIALYEKKGFTFAGARKKYYGGKIDARIYWLYL